MEIKDARSLPSIAQEDLRQKAIKAVMDGKKQVEIAGILNVTRQAVGKWVSKFRREGEESLKAKRKGRPEGGKLLPWQAAQIVNALIDHHPEQLKLPFYLWTREAVAQLIEQRFGIRLSVWTVGRYWRDGDSLPRSQSGVPMSKTRRWCKTGWRRIIRYYSGKLKRKRL